MLNVFFLKVELINICRHLNKIICRHKRGANTQMLYKIHNNFYNSYQKGLKTMLKRSQPTFTLKKSYLNKIKEIVHK